MNKRLVFIILLGSIIISACGIAGMGLPSESSSLLPGIVNSRSDRTLTIFAASSLTDAFQEIGKAFETSHPGLKINFNFAGSQILRTQLEQGAVVDIFASADHENMQSLLGENIVVHDSVQDFAENRMIMILPSSNPAGLETLADLSRKNLKLVLADASVPAGGYTRQLLSNLSDVPGFGANYVAKVLANVVSYELDVRQVVTKVELGEAEAGIVYESDAVAVPGLISLSIPDEYNIEASYPIAILSSSPEKDLAADFIDYVLSPEGQTTLSRWGFIPGKKP